MSRIDFQKLKGSLANTEKANIAFELMRKNELEKLYVLINEIDYSKLGIEEKKKFNEARIKYYFSNQKFALCATLIYELLFSEGWNCLTDFSFALLLRSLIELKQEHEFWFVYNALTKYRNKNLQQIEIEARFAFKDYVGVINSFEKNAVLPKDYVHKYIEALYKEKRFDDVVDSLYDFTFKVCSNEKILTICVSHDVGKYLYYKQTFNGAVLYITQKTFQSYYIVKPDIIANRISRFVKAGGYQKIFFIGSSKGGFAAILYSLLLKRKFKSLDIQVSAFSPIVKIDDNGVREMPSANYLLKLINKYEYLHESFDKYGNLEKIFKCVAPPNIFGIYGEFNNRDAKQMELIRQFINPVELNEVPFHATISLFPPIRNIEEGSLRKYFFGAFRSDPDLIYLNGNDRIEFEDFVKFVKSNSTKFDLILPTLVRN